MTDAELTKAAASSFPQTVSGVTVRDPVVRTTTSGVRLTASARVFFGTTEFVMTGTPYASAGRVAVRVDSITLGGLGLPDSVRAQAAASVETRDRRTGAVDGERAEGLARGRQRHDRGCDAALARERVDELAEELCFPVEVRTGRHARHADDRDRLTANDALPEVHERAGDVEVAALESAAV